MRNGIIITALTLSVVNKNVYSQMSKMYLLFNQKKFLYQTAQCCLNLHLFRMNYHDTGLCTKCKVSEMSLIFFLFAQTIHLVVEF